MSKITEEPEVNEKDIIVKESSLKGLMRSVRGKLADNVKGYTEGVKTDEAEISNSDDTEVKKGIRLGKIYGYLGKYEKLFWWLMLSCVFVFTVIIGYVGWVNKELGKLDNMRDTRLLEYEAYIGTVNNIGKLYGIYDETSYQDAKQNINFAPDLKNRLFKSEHYKGVKYNTPPQVTVEDVKYEYNPYSSIKKYLATIYVTYENGVVTRYNVVLEYSDNMIIRMQGY